MKPDLKDLGTMWQRRRTLSTRMINQILEKVDTLK